MSVPHKDSALAEDADDPTVRIGVLAAAHRKPTSVERDKPLEYAIGIMQKNYYSQLPVTDTGSLVGAISWESIGRELAHAPYSKLVSDCMDDLEVVPVVHIETPLLDVVEKIENTMYVLIRGRNEEISGIVTASDIAGQFKRLAEAFLGIREIELRLRRLICGKFQPDELKKSANRAGDKKRINRPEDLMLGNFITLLDDSGHWSQLGVASNKNYFIERLKAVNTIRRTVMHFNPNGLTAQDMETLRQFADFLSELVSEGQSNT